MAVDLTGTFNVTRLAIPHLKKSAAGSIIMMSPLVDDSAIRIAAHTMWPRRA